MQLVNETMTDRELLMELRNEVSALRQSHDTILSQITEIKDQFGPALEAAMKSPVFKMLGV